MPRKPTPRKSNWVPLSFKLNPATYKAFKALTEAEHRSMAGEIRRLVEERLADHADEQREAA